MSIAAIGVANLSFRYADAVRWALRDISFSVAAGETLLVLGPSGCGKSTLALCLNGLIPQQIEGELQGEVRIWGQPHSVQSSEVWKTSELWTGSRWVGEVFQDPETQIVMPRVDEEVAFGLENMGLPPDEMPGRITEALALVGLGDQPRAWVDSLSGGEKQRLALAAVLAMQPGILVLDEPTANLDPAAAHAFFQTLARLKAERGTTIVLIEHRLDAALPLVDRIVAMNQSGQIIAQGTTAEVFSGRQAALAEQGIWLPQTCLLTQSLARRGWPLAGCPLALDEVEASLRRLLQDTVIHPHPNPLPMRERGRAPSLTQHGPAVAIADLSFAYPGNPPALRGVDLTIERGRFFALVGGNGSGKTTLAKHLVGLLRPAAGQVEILGRLARDQSRAELARQVGYVFQNPEHQFVTQRVADELAYSLRGRWGKEEADQRVAELLRVFGLTGYEDANPFALSQGQKRRLSVATMLALRQPVLILDEPTFGQDQQSTAALMGILQTLHAEGVTIIFITHDMQLVAEYADHVAVMHEGRVICQGEPRALFQDAALLQQASLALPPLAELANRLGLPSLLTLAAWEAWADGIATPA